ncbi:GcrA-like cell cycle regulator protein [Microcystis phage Mwe-JY13]
MTGARSWTDEQKLTLTTMHGDGASFSQIALAMGGGTTRSMVAAYVSRHRETFARRVQPVTVEYDIDELAKAWGNDSLSSAAIGRMFGLSAAYVRDIANRNRDKFPRRQPGSTQIGPKKPKKPKPPRQNPRISSVWTRRDPSQPAPSYYDPLPMDDYEIARLPHAKPLHDLERNECKWPLGEDRPYRFCACQTTQAGTYCAHHVVKAIGVGTKSEREAVKIGRAA